MGERLTKTDIEKIKKEIEHRTLVIRKEAIEAVKEARAQGDLSENFEYYAAKKYKNENESRITYLEKMLRSAEVVEDDSSEDEVGLNDTVELLFEDDKSVAEYKIVTSIRANSLKKLISIESPMGAALVGHSIGDRVTVKVSDDISYVVKIQDIVKADDEDEDIRKF